jgi:hypothetical protein
MLLHDLTTSTVWSASLPGRQHRSEFFGSEAEAYDAAYDWSIEMGGLPIIIYCNGIPWTEVTA